MLKMLVTRPDPEASETAARLAALQIEPVSAPLLTQTILPTSLPDPKGFAALAVTSGQALQALSERGALSNYTHLPLYAVGDKTAAFARDAGFGNVVSAGGTMADLVELLAHHAFDGPIFYPAARDRSGDLAKSLAPFGRMVICTEIYAMDPISALPPGILAALEQGEIAAALFYSRRTAAAFSALTQDGLSRAARQRLHLLCLSEAIAEPLINAHFVRIGLADYPSEDAMMSLALSFARDQNAS